MRICYAAFIRLPTEKAHGVQIMKTCEAFTNNGIKTDLLVPNRKTPIKEYSFEYYGIKKTFHIVQKNILDLVNFGPLGFIISALLFSEAVRVSKEFHSADYVYSRDAFVLLQYFFLKKKLVYEAHTKPTFISRFVAKRASYLVVISKGLYDEYSRKGIREDKIIIAPDAVSAEDFSKSFDRKNTERELNIPLNKKNALYVGRIDSLKGADVFAASSQFLSEEISCVLVGPGPIKDRLKENYPKAVFVGEIPYRDLPKVLSIGDVLIIPNSAKDLNSSLYTSPLKAFAYMATGKPIVASRVPALEEVFSGYRNVYFFEPDNPRSLADTIKTVRTSSVQNSPRVYSWDDRARTILEKLHDTH